MCACACTRRSPTRWSSHPPLCQTLLLLPSSFFQPGPLNLSPALKLRGSESWLGMAERGVSCFSQPPPSRTSNTCSQMRIAGRARRNRALKQHISDGRACFARLTAPYPQQLSHDALLSSSLSTAERCGDGGEC